MTGEGRWDGGERARAAPFPQDSRVWRYTFCMTRTTKSERMLANMSSPKRAMLALLPRRLMSLPTLTRHGRTNVGENNQSSLGVRTS